MLTTRSEAGAEERWPVTRIGSATAAGHAASTAAATARRRARSTPSDRAAASSTTAQCTVHGLHRASNQPGATRPAKATMAADAATSATPVIATPRTIDRSRVDLGMGAGYAPRQAHD